MKLIIGLGNPGTEYKGTRHNVGWAALEHYAREHGLHFAAKTRFKARVAEFHDHNERVVLAMPTTYYNLSGESARAIADFYKLAPQDILVVHDEMFLPFATLRTRRGGSDAGNNGIKSLSEHVGQGTYRLRIGTGSDTRLNMDDADFVLSRFTEDEQHTLDNLYPKITFLINTFIAGQLEITTDKSSPASSL